jgi:hypothetical protein
MQYLYTSYVWKVMQYLYTSYVYFLETEMYVYNKSK